MQLQDMSLSWKYTCKSDHVLSTLIDHIIDSEEVYSMFGRSGTAHTLQTLKIANANGFCLLIKRFERNFSYFAMILPLYF